MSLSPSSSRRRGLEGGDVHPRGDRRDVRAHAPGRVLEQVARADPRRRLDHPAHGRLELARDLRRVARRDDTSPRPTSSSSSRRSVATIGGDARSTGPPGVSIAATRVRAPDGSTTTSSPRGQHAAGDPPRVAAVVAGADRPLDREAHVVEVAVAVDLDRLELLEQRRRVVPGQPRRSASTTLSPSQRGDRHRAHVGDPELRAELAERAPRSRGSAPRRSRRDPSCSRTPRGAGCRAAPPGRRAGATARAGPCGRRSAPARGRRSTRR